MGVFPNLGQPTRPDLDQMRRQIGRIDPNDARGRVEQMLRSGQMTLDQFDALKARAQEIARQLGL